MKVSHATGRVYDFPQILEIEYNAETETAIFIDRSRGISGRVHILVFNPEYDSVRVLSKEICSAYDTGAYESVSV